MTPDWLPLSPAEQSAVALSMKVAGAAVLVGLPISVVVAMVLAHTKIYGKTVVNILVLLPLVMPPVVTGYLLLIAFGTNGLIGKFLLETYDFTFAFQWTGAALAAGIMAFPLMVRPVRLALEGINPKLYRASKSLGAGSIMSFFTITLPLCLPGILAALVLGFAKALGEFGATITFVSNISDETRTLPLAIYTLLQSPNGEASLFRLTALSLALAIIAVIISEYLNHRVKKRLALSEAGQ